MSLILARIIVSVVIVVAPFLLFAVGTRQQGGAMILILPLAGAIPAVILALLLFVPIENVLESRGLSQWKNIAIPVVGSLLIFVFGFGIGYLVGGLDAFIKNSFRSGVHGWVVLLFWMGLGMLWGIAWRASEWLARSLGLTNG